MTRLGDAWASTSPRSCCSIRAPTRPRLGPSSVGLPLVRDLSTSSAPAATAKWRRVERKASMSTGWPPLRYESWSATSDPLHPHTQVPGKLAVELAPPEPQLQHAALRLTARGWETLALPAPDGAGSLVVTLDLRTHEALLEHGDGRSERIALMPDRPVADVTRDV